MKNQLFYKSQGFAAGVGAAGAADTSGTFINDGSPLTLPIKQPNISTMVDALKAISDENRYRIVQLLSKDSLCVCEIEKRLDLPQNLVSHHLSVLKKAGLIKDCRCGKNNYYSLNKKSLNKIIKMLIKLGEEK